MYQPATPARVGVPCWRCGLTSPRESISARGRGRQRRRDSAIAGGAAGADGWAAGAGIGDGPLHAGHYEDWGVIDPAAAAAGTAATTVDLIAVVFVIGHPIDVIEGAVVIFQGVVIIVPELLQTFFFAGQALVALGEDVPAGLIAAAGQRAPAGVRVAGVQGQSQHGTSHQADPFHRDSFHREDPSPSTGRQSAGGAPSSPDPTRAGVTVTPCGLVFHSSAASGTVINRPIGQRSAEKTTARVVCGTCLLRKSGKIGKGSRACVISRRAGC